MKKGDIVTIKDSNYTRSVIDGKLVAESLAYGDEAGKQYVIIETNCTFPVVVDECQACSAPSLNLYPTFNNTVIQALDSGKVVFIEERFLRPVLPTYKIMCIFGKIVEVSDEQYIEILRQR